MRLYFLDIFPPGLAFEAREGNLSVKKRSSWFDASRVDFISRDAGCFQCFSYDPGMKIYRNPRDLESLKGVQPDRKSVV